MEKKKLKKKLFYGAHKFILINTYIKWHNISYLARHHWLMPIILATWEAKPRQIVCETPISKAAKAKWTGGGTQVLQHLLCI
jgi:hypothetical protein